jgi:hypothetical protein
VRKFAPDRPYSDPEKAARKLLEIANSVEAVQTAESPSRRSTRSVSGARNAAEYSAGLKLAIERGWLVLRAARCEVHAGGRRSVRLRRRPSLPTFRFSDGWLLPRR